MIRTRVGIKVDSNKMKNVIRLLVERVIVSSSCIVTMFVRNSRFRDTGSSFK